MLMNERTVVTIFVFFVTFCGDPTALSWPGEPFVPSASWRDEWALLEACSGVRGDFDRVRWYRSPDGALGRQVLGRWEPPHSIYLVSWVVDNGIGHTRKHEMLHDLLQTGFHPPAFEHCGVL